MRAMQAALTEANLEAHEFRLSFAADIVRSFAQKRQERLNAVRTLAQIEIVAKESNGVPRAAGVAATSALSQDHHTISSRATPNCASH